jgi:uncharacterized membrane protein
MSFAILRTSKITASKVGGVNAHNTREMEVPNCDPKESNFNYQLAGTKSLKNDIENRLEEAGIHKTRKNAVLGIEHMMTASPEYFENDKDNKKFYEFENECVNWLKDRYGEKNIINVHAHFDEHTPHLHAIVTPILEKNVKWKNGTESGIKRENRLSARDFINGSKAMTQMQDSFSNHLKNAGLNLERGEKGSKATHTEIKTFYNSIQEAQKEIKQQKPSLIDNKVTFEKRDKTENALSFKWVTEDKHRENQENKANQLIKNYQNQAIELSKQLDNIKHLLKEESRLKSNLEVSNDKLTYKNNSLVQENKNLRKENKDWRAVYSDLKTEYRKEKKFKENNFGNLHLNQIQFFNALGKDLDKNEKEKIREDLREKIEKGKPSYQRIRNERDQEKEALRKQEEEAKKQTQQLKKQEIGVKQIEQTEGKKKNQGRSI